MTTLLQTSEPQLRAEAHCYIWLAFSSLLASSSAFFWFFRFSTLYTDRQGVELSLGGLLQLLWLTCNAERRILKTVPHTPCWPDKFLRRVRSCYNVQCLGVNNVMNGNAAKRKQLLKKSKLLKSGHVVWSEPGFRRVRPLLCSTLAAHLFVRRKRKMLNTTACFLWRSNALPLINYDR